MQGPQSEKTARYSCRAVAFGALISAHLVGCYSAGEGVSPPADRIYFPVGLSLSNPNPQNEGKLRHLIVANSDFDLQYNAGTLMVLDADDLDKYVPVPCASDDVCLERRPGTHCDLTPSEGHAASYLCVDDNLSPCGALSLRTAADQLLYPGPCDYLDPAHAPGGESLIVDEVKIGAFATDIIYRNRPATAESGEAGRVFVPVRGDATIHWADISGEGKIECGQQLASGACDDQHRAGDDPDRENDRDLRMAPEPFAIDANESGDVLLVSNQTTGRVSLFENEWSQNSLRLTFEVTGLPQRPMGVAALPLPGLMLAREQQFPPGFLVSFRNAAEIDLIRYFSDSAANPARPYAARANSAPITVNATGTDARGIAVDASVRRAAEVDCARKSGVDVGCVGECLNQALSADARDQYFACLSGAGATPLDVYVASRSPPTLLVGRTTPSENALQSTDLPAFYDTFSLSQGPSRVVTGTVIVGVDANGQKIRERRVFVVCFDSRRIYVYDPVRRRMETAIVTGRGPHAIAVDSQRAWLFVGHFTDSYLGIVSLDRRFPATYGQMLATVGKPAAPRASK